MRAGENTARLAVIRRAVRVAARPRGALRDAGIPAIDCASAAAAPCSATCQRPRRAAPAPALVAVRRRLPRLSPGERLAEATLAARRTWGVAHAGGQPIRRPAAHPPGSPQHTPPPQPVSPAAARRAQFRKATMHTRARRFAAALMALAASAPMADAHVTFSPTCARTARPRGRLVFPPDTATNALLEAAPATARMPRVRVCAPTGFLAWHCFA